VYTALCFVFSLAGITYTIVGLGRLSIAKSAHKTAVCIRELKETLGEGKER